MFCWALQYNVIETDLCTVSSGYDVANSMHNNMFLICCKIWERFITGTASVHLLFSLICCFSVPSKVLALCQNSILSVPDFRNSVLDFFIGIREFFFFVPQPRFRHMHSRYSSCPATGSRPPQHVAWSVLAVSHCRSSNSNIRGQRFLQDRRSSRSNRTQCF